MSPKSIQEYTEIFVTRYRKARYKDKTKIIDEYCSVTGFHRKHAIRKLNNFRLYTKHKKKKTGKKSKYARKDLIIVLKRIWQMSNLPCSKIMKTILPIWLPHYTKHYGDIDEEITRLLLKISPASIDRIFRTVRLKYGKKGLSATKPGNMLRKNIQIKTEQWNEFTAGFIESDTVHHCGESVAGEYALTIDYTDIATEWTEQRAIWGKGESGVLAQTKDVEESLPFKTLGFDSDNGHEFINLKMYKYFTEREEPVMFTRSRAYKKNDNAHIEQKNYTHVRQWLGYNRFDNPECVPLLNDLYKNEWRLYHNFFIPSVKLIDKKRIGSKMIKSYDKPKTPFQRLMEQDDKIVSKDKKQELKSLYESLDPFELRRQMEKKIDKILKLSMQKHETSGNNSI